MGSRTIHRLTATQIGKLKGDGRYCDGGGLYLLVKGSARSWVFRYQVGGPIRDMGLGTAKEIPLAEARTHAAQLRALVARKIDPLNERRRREQEADAEAARTTTFEECAADLICSKRPSWRSSKHAAQWESSLATYVNPHIGKLPVGAVTTDHIKELLEPIWLKLPPTAGRVLERIAKVLDRATALNQRQGDNPARWRGHMEFLMPKLTAVRVQEHHPALPYNQIAHFMAQLDHEKGFAASALKVLILTATRTNEVLGARCTEFDLDKAMWIIPGSRMKTGKEHRVPLSAAVIDVLRPLLALGISEFVFPGQKKTKPLCHNAMAKVLERMGWDGITVHGFRSTFRDWAAERTNCPREVAEMALAHSIGNAVEAAYRRGDLFAKRQELMAGWADFCARARQESAILPFHKAS